MDVATKTTTQVKQAVPFLWVSHIDATLRFYIDGLGFEMVKNWVDAGKLRWCWLQLGVAALMFQEFWQEGQHASPPHGVLGEGVAIYYICEDAPAIYREVQSRGIHIAEPPFVGNGMWVTSLLDPDGYRLHFESLTNVPEETVYSEGQE